MIRRERNGGRAALVAAAPRRRPSPHRTRQARPSRFVFPPCPRALRVDRPEARDRLPAPRAEAARVHRVASGRSTRSARRLGDTEIGFEVGLRAASPTGEGREMIGWKGDGKRSDCHTGQAHGRAALVAAAPRRRPSPHRTRQARPSRFVFPPYLRALRVDRTEARDRLPAPRAEAARVHRVPGVYAKEVIAQGSSVLLCYDAHIEKIG